MRHDSYFDVATASICFVVKVAGKFVVCHVTEGWLYDKLGPMRLRWGLLDAYRRNARLIDSAAVQRWHASGGVEPIWLDRSVMLKPARAALRRTDGAKATPNALEPPADSRI